MPRGDIKISTLGQFAIALYTCAQLAIAVAVHAFGLQQEFTGRQEGAATVIDITRKIQVEIGGAGLRDQAADIGECLGAKLELIRNQAGVIRS
ncbi:Uncharacterised protein [Yersinia kristensenii]|nr:Uncharacterised protein [Yersinia kristensenii]